MKWEKVKLGELYTVHNGLSKSREFFGSGFPFLSFSTVFNNYFIPEQLSDLVQSNEKEQSSYSILRGDVFVTRTSETADELGISCVALKDYPYATYNGFTKRMRPIDVERVSPKYIGYYMRWERFRAKFQAFSTMTTRASLRNEELLGLEISLPPIEIQEKIADILSAYDDLIENNQKQIKLLEEAAQRLYKAWFVDFRFPGHESTPIINGIPKGWKKGAVNSVVSLLSGYSFKSSEFTEDGLYKLVTIKNVKDGEFDGEKVCFIKELPQKMPSHCILKDGDILLSLTGNVGRVCIVHGKHYLLNQRVAKFKTEFPAYAYFLFRSDDMVATLNNLANGVAQQNLSPIRTENLNIHIPSQGVLMSFERNVYPMLNRIVTLNKQITSLRESRDRLLPKLMSGELEV